MMRCRSLLPLAVLLAVPADGFPATAPPAPGTAKGSVTVGASPLALTHAYALPRDPQGGGGAGHHVLLSSKALPVAEIQDVTDADSVGMFLLDQEMQGIEALVSADGEVERVNIRHPELESLGMALGVMLLETPTLEITSRDADVLQGKRFTGRLFTAKAITDPRISGKTLACDVTFSAAVANAKAP